MLQWIWHYTVHTMLQNMFIVLFLDELDLLSYLEYSSMEKDCWYKEVITFIIMYTLSL